MLKLASAACSSLDRSGASADYHWLTDPPGPRPRSAQVLAGAGRAAWRWDTCGAVAAWGCGCWRCRPVMAACSCRRRSRSGADTAQTDAPRILCTIRDPAHPRVQRLGRDRDRLLGRSTGDAARPAGRTKAGPVLQVVRVIGGHRTVRRGGHRPAHGREQRGCRHGRHELEPHTVTVAVRAEFRRENGSAALFRLAYRDGPHDAMAILASPGPASCSSRPGTAELERSTRGRVDVRPFSRPQGRCGKVSPRSRCLPPDTRGGFRSDGRPGRRPAGAVAGGTGQGGECCDNVHRRVVGVDGRGDVAPRLKSGPASARLPPTDVRR